MTLTASDIIRFWFHEIDGSMWFTKDPVFDDFCKKKFSAIHASISVGETFKWRETPEGRLAEILVLDQFSRNMFRDTAGAFASDPLALLLAQEAVHSGDDLKLPLERRTFIYMPYMHSESLIVHEEAIRLFSTKGLEQNLDYEYRHKRILERFGRYPHRNGVLSRVSTPEEIEFLKQPGSGF
jgi:uncharacterized protein (DUF924 family)